MKHAKSSGFSLLEVLITVLLITVGVLGMVAMQGRGIQYTIDSVERTHAATLANELMEIIRATPSAVLDDPDNSPLLFSSLPAGNNSTCFNIAANALVTEQVGCWASRVRALLPDADTLSANFVSCLSTTPGVCDSNGSALEIRMAWNASGEGCLSAAADAELDDRLCTISFRTQI